MNFKYFSHNGVMKPVAEAVVPLPSIEYSYGFGVYETVRVHSSVPYYLRDHVDRLMESARILGLEHSFASDSVVLNVQKLVAKTDSPAFNLKLLLIGGRTSTDANLYIICLNPLFPDKKMYRDGVKTITVQHERNFPHAKTLNMLGSYLAYEKARSMDAYDALLVNKKDEIVEGTRTNFFVMKDRTIVSPPEEEILLGVTRKMVLMVARAHNFEVAMRPIKRAELGEYDAAFLTSTSSNIMPIRSVDAHTFSITSAPLRALMVAFDRFLDASKGVV